MGFIRRCGRGVLNRLRRFLPAPDQRKYFHKLYSQTQDHWSYETSAYESEKYEYTLGVIRGLCPKQVLEIGCSIGVFTRRLADHVEHLYAIDFSDIAVARASKRCHGLPNVTLSAVDLRDLQLPVQVDLILAAEVLYYIDRKEKAWRQTVSIVNSVLAPGGHIVVVGPNIIDAGNNWESYFPKYSGNRIIVERTEYKFVDPRPYRLSVFRKAT